MTMFLGIAEKKEFGRAGEAPRRGEAPARLVLHTTETRSLPAYSSPPHLTVAVGHPDSMPSLTAGEVRVWQHVSLDRTAYALLHPSGTEETNHMGSHCVQIEIVTCVADQPGAGVVGNRGRIPASLMQAVAGVVAAVLEAVPGIDPSVRPATSKWSDVGSFGASASQRFSVQEWREFNGICGHQHVPANAHWDPGAFDIDTLSGLVAGSRTSSAMRGSGSRSPSMTHVVSPGETLGAIAARFDVPLSDVRAANPDIVNADLIRPGDVLAIPPRGGGRGRGASA